MNQGFFTIGQVIGFVIYGAVVLAPGLALAGFRGGTSWSVLGWVCISIFGGFFAGLLITPRHRFAGAIGGMVGAPLGLLALYFYARNRDSIYRIEATFVSMVSSLPGLVVYFILRLLTDAIFPRAREDQSRDSIYDEDDDEPRQRRKRRRKVDDDDDEDDDEPRPRSKRRRDDDDDDEPLPRSKRRRDDDDDDEPLPRSKRRRDEDDEPPPRSKRRRDDDDDDEPPRKNRRHLS